MAKRNLIELAAQLSVGEATQALKMLREAAESTGRKLEGMKAELASLQKQESEGDLGIEQAKHLKQLRKEVKDTETVYKSLQAQLSENRKMQSAVSRVLVEGLEKQNGTVINRMIKEAEQKLLNFFGKEREMKVKVLMEDGTTTFINVTKQKLVELIQAGKSEIAERKAGATEALKQVEQWATAVKNTNEKQRAAQEKELAFHKTNVENIEKEQGARREAAEQAKRDMDENARLAKELDARQEKLRKTGVNPNGAHRVTEESAAAAAAKYAEEQRKTAALEAERLELQKRMDAASASAAGNSATQLDTEKKLALTEEQRKQRLSEIEQQLASLRGVKKSGEIKDPAKFTPTARTPEEYIIYKQEYERRQKLKGEADFLSNEKGIRDSLLNGAHIERTDPLGITSVETLKFAKEQLGILKSAGSGSSAKQEMPEKYEQMHTELVSMPGLIDALVGQAQKAGIGINDFLFGKIKEEASNAATYLSRIFENGGGIPDSVAKKVDAAFSGIKEKMGSIASSINTGQSPSGVADVAASLSGNEFGGALKSLSSGTIVRPTKTERPWFMEKSLALLRKQLESEGKSGAEVETALADARKKLESSGISEEYKKYYAAIEEDLNRLIAEHDKHVAELKDKYGTAQEMSKTISLGDKSRDKAGSVESVPLSAVREKIGVRAGIQRRVERADGTVETRKVGEISLVDGEREQKLLELLRQRAELQGAVSEAKTKDSAASDAAIAATRKELEAKEQAISVQKKAEEQARKEADAQQNTLAASKEYSENEMRLAEVKAKSAVLSQKATDAEKQYKDYLAQSSVQLKESEKFLQENDTSVIRNADDMRRYINVLKEQAPLMSQTAVDYARYTRAIDTLKVKYEEFVQNTQQNMKHLRTASDATLTQMRNHFQSIITTAGASSSEIRKAQKAIDKIDAEQHARSMKAALVPLGSDSTGALQKRIQDAQALQKSAMTTRGEWRQLQAVIDRDTESLQRFNEEQLRIKAQQDFNAMKNPAVLGDSEIQAAIRRMQEYASAVGVTSSIRKELNQAIARGNAELERKQGGDNLVRMSEQYKILTNDVNGLGSASDDVLRKQQAFWLQQSALTTHGGADGASYLDKYKEITAEIERRQRLQKQVVLDGQLGGQDREKILTGGAAATEQQLRAAIELTTLLNKEVNVTSDEYKRNCQLIAQGTQLLGEQKRVQDENARAMEKSRQQHDAIAMEGDLTRASKQQLDVLRQMYTEKLQVNTSDTASRDSLIAINREEQRRLDLNRQIAEEASRMSQGQVSSILSNPLASTSDQVRRATEQAEGQVKSLYAQGDAENAAQLAVQIDNARNAQRQFNEETKRWVMADKLQQIGSLTKAALAEQEKFWREQMNSVKQGTTEFAKYSENLRKVIGAQGGVQEAAVMGDGGFVDQINNGTLTTIEQMRQAKQAVEEFKAKFADVHDTEQMQQLDQAIAQVTHDLNMAEKGMLSLDEAEKRLSEKTEARSQEEKNVNEGKPAGPHVENFSQVEIERLNKSLREAYSYYEAIGDAQGIARTQKAMAMLASETERTRQSAAALATGEKRISAAIDNPRAEKSLKVLQAAYNKLKQEIDNADDSQAAYLKNADKLREINGQIQRVTRSMEQQKSILSRMGDALVSHWGVYLNLETIIGQIQGLFSGNIKLSDSMANVQKVTSMANDELATMVNRLNELDTRTSQSELMKLAEQGGKLGIYNRGGVQAMTDFVEMANQITSTLGEDIGGAEAVDSLVKVNDLVNKGAGMSLYEGLSRIGSGVLSVGNNSAAAYADVVNFVNQVGAVGSVSGVSMPQLIALGGTFSSLGAHIDQSATSINKLLVGLQRNAGKVASVTGQSAAELQAMIDSGDTFEALVSVMERVHDMGGNTSQVIYDILDQFGGRKNAQMFTAMALLIDNVSRLREEMFYAKQGYEENTLMASEYARVQDNLAGVLERIGNNIKETFMNPEVQDAMRSIAEGIGWIVDRLLWMGRLFAWAFTGLGKGVTQAITAIVALVAIFARLAKKFALIRLIGNDFKYLGMQIANVCARIVGANALIGKTQEKMDKLGKAGMGGWLAVLTVIITAVGMLKEFMERTNALANQREKIRADMESTMTSSLAQADSMFSALERSVEPMKAAREEHEKTQKALDETSRKFEQGKATQEELTKAQEENRESSERLTGAKVRMASALNSLNSAYGSYVKLTEADVENSRLVEAAHSRIAAAIREETLARAEQKMRETVQEDFDEKLADADKDLNKASKPALKEGGKSYDELNKMAKVLVEEAYSRSVSEGKPMKSYWISIRKELWKELDTRTGIHDPENTKFRMNEYYLDDVKKYFDKYVEYYEQLDNVSKLIGEKQEVVKEANERDLLNALQKYEEEWRGMEEAAINYPKNIKNASVEELKAAIEPLQGYVDTLSKMLKDSSAAVTDDMRKKFVVFTGYLNQMKGTLQTKLATEIWGDEGEGYKGWSSKHLTEEYDRLEAAHNKIKEGINVREALPELMLLKNAATLSDEQLRDAARKRAEDIKNELDRRGQNTSGKFKWNSGSHDKNKWKSDTKEQYNAYLKELDDFYTKQRMELEQLRADEQMTELEFNHRTEELDKEHYSNRARLRNMFLKDERRDLRAGLLDDTLVNRIFGDGQMSAEQIAAWKKSFEKTRALINRLGDAFVDEIALKSSEDRVKAVQILRKAQDEMEKAVLEGDPFGKVLREYEDKMDKLHQIFGMADWMAGNEHDADEYQKRIDMLRGFSANILSTSESEFVQQMAQTKEFAGRTVGEYRLLYDSLLQLRDDFDEAARKQARKDLRLMDARVENGQYYKDQLAIYEKALEDMDWGSPEAQSVLSMAEMLKKRQNVKDKNGKEVSYNARQKARLENAKKKVASEEAVGNTGVANEINLSKAKLEQARMETIIAYDLLTARRSYMDANIAEAERELEKLREQKASQEQINAKEADLAAMKIMQSEAIAEANEKAEESERALSLAEAELLSARIKNAKEWQGIFTKYVKSIGTAGSAQAESNAFKIAEINARRELGLYKETMKQRYLILQQNGKYEEKYMDEEEYLRMENRIAAENEMREATSKMLNDFGEKMAQSLTDAYQRMMQLQAEQEQEAEKQNVITGEQQSGIQQRMANEQSYTAFYKNELAMRLQETREFYRQLNLLSAGSPSVVLGEGSEYKNAQRVGIEPGDIQSNTLSSGIADVNDYVPTSTENVGVIPDSIRDGLAGMGVTGMQMDGLQSQWTQAASSMTDYYNSTITTGQQADEKLKKSNNKMVSSMISSMNMYGIVYGTVMNDNLSASQKAATIALQTTGQMIMSLLTASLAQVGSDTATGLAGAIAKAFSQLGPIGGAAAIAGITATIGAAMAVATKKVTKSKKEVAAATGVGAGKLTTGMLTYADGRYLGDAGFAEGNSYAVDGADGKTYNARYEGAIKKTGIRSGVHFGIFSEKKPEMVIDGDTTALIHKRYPDVEKTIRYLSTVRRLPPIPQINHKLIRHSMEVISRTRSLGMAGAGRFALSTYADGNVGEVMKTLGATGAAMQATLSGQGGAAPIAQNAVIAQLAQTMSELQKTLADGIRAEVSTRSFAKAKRFEKRNGIKGGLLD